MVWLKVNVPLEQEDNNEDIRQELCEKIWQV
jgi:hypothetical protein